MPIPAIIYGAGGLIVSGIFRLAASPATPRIIDAAQKSAATVGQTLSNGFNYASQAYDWLMGDDEPAHNSEVADLPMCTIEMAALDVPNFRP